MVSKCVKWKQADATHFNGFCTNQFRQTTPPSGVKVDGGCYICVGPAQRYGVCTGCVVPPPRTYIATINIDGNGIGPGNPDFGCGTSSYGGEFLLYSGPSACEWSSAEKELRARSSAGSGTNPVICEAIEGLSSVVRSRVTMQISSLTVMGTLRTVFAVTANWYGAHGPYATGLQLCSVTSRGFASKLDCWEAVSDMPHHSKEINIGLLALTWANPYVNFSGGGAQITMTASVRPLD